MQTHAKLLPIVMSDPGSGNKAKVRRVEEMKYPLRSKLVKNKVQQNIRCDWMK